MLVLLLLDAGLRLGEALGLTWGSIAWGESGDASSRSLEIAGNRPRGGAPSLLKSGRTRRVGLSRRLRHALLDLYQSRCAPGTDRLVLEPSNFRSREWRRICAKAGISHRAMKDLRDTFASQLLTSGVSLGYVSKQLGTHTGRSGICSPERCPLSTDRTASEDATPRKKGLRARRIVDPLDPGRRKRQ